MAKILIVEDDEQVSVLMADILGLKGHECLRAMSVDEACAIMWSENAEFDLVLMDLLLKGFDGVIAGLALRGLGYYGPMLIVTGYVANINKDLFAAAKFTDIVIKQFSVEELQCIVQHHLKGESDGLANQDN